MWGSTMLTDLAPTMLKLVEACEYVDWLKIQDLRRAVNAP